MPNRKSPSSKKALRGGTFRAFCYSVFSDKLNIPFSDIALTSYALLKCESGAKSAVEYLHSSAYFYTEGWQDVYEVTSYKCIGE